MENLDNTMIYRALDFKEPHASPESMYCAVQFEGKTWHLFNAGRMPLGRIATMAANFLRGKHKPNYVHNRMGEHGDYCVIVNAAKQYMTGRKA
jgi:ribosomal protein L13